MKRSVPMLALVISVVVSLLTIGTASAHTTTIDTRLSIDKTPNGAIGPNDRVVISGRLGPARCRDGQQVTLFQRQPGRDDALGTDSLDNDGEYSFSLTPNSDMRVYAKVQRAVIRSDYQHSHVCSRGRSDTIQINVRR